VRGQLASLDFAGARTYVNPAVALMLGVVVLGEPFTLGAVVGFALILLGLFLATRRGPQAKVVIVEPAAQHPADVR
jgi:drug/metabolite transporter (DMT)-like permease